MVKRNLPHGRLRKKIVLVSTSIIIHFKFPHQLVKYLLKILDEYIKVFVNYQK